MTQRATDALEAAAEHFAAVVHRNVTAQVALAWSIERDRLYSELAELRDEVHTLNRLYGARYRHWHEPDEIAQFGASVKVPDYPATTLRSSA